MGGFAQLQRVVEVPAVSVQNRSRGYSTAFAQRGEGPGVTNTVSFRGVQEKRGSSRL